MSHGRGNLRFAGVSKTYRVAGDVVRAVADVDLAVAPGDSLGIIGPNGAGKSTLLRLAAGVTAPTMGSIKRTGTTCSVIELGAGIHPDLTGAENVELLAALHGISRGQLRGLMGEIVEFAGLEGVMDDRCRTYSTGMLARLGLSVAVHSEPDLLLLDEVLSVGDLSFQAAARSRVAALRGGGTTVVLVSHDLELIEELCDRTVLLVGGSVEADGQTERIVHRYRGLPDELPEPDALRVVLDRSVVRSGSDVTARLTDIPLAGAVTLRVEMIVHEHPTFLTVGQDLSVVFAAARAPAPVEPSSLVRLGTAGLPDGRYQVRCSIDDRHGEPIASTTAPLTLTGHPGPFAIRLEGEGSIAHLGLDSA